MFLTISLISSIKGKQRDQNFIREGKSNARNKNNSYLSQEELLEQNVAFMRGKIKISFFDFVPCGL